MECGREAPQTQKYPQQNLTISSENIGFNVEMVQITLNEEFYMLSSFPGSQKSTLLKNLKDC